MRDEGYNGESVSPQAENDVPDRVHLAVDALELGTWSLDIASGQVDATPQTYQLFGLNPGTVEGSHDLFMRQVHPADRPGVEEWLSRSKHMRTRTALVFRVDHPDGSIHWIRSSGRVFRDRRGKPIRMVGVCEDVSADLQRQPLKPEDASSSGAGTSFSIRQVAHVLGLAEATLKRIAQSGSLKWLRSTRKNSRRIAPEDLKRIFEKFYRVPRAESADQQGTGLGLTLVREIMESHGGQVTAQSELGRGSTFTLRLPIQRSSEH